MTEYIPTDDQEHINYPKEHPLKEFAILIISSLVLIGLLYAVAGPIGEHLALKISPEKEAEYFGKVSLGPEVKTDTSRFLLIEDFFNFARKKDFPFLKLYEWDQKQMNAFAIPGGTILMTSGLLDRIKTKPGLAFVLGHEIGHFKHRDHMRKLGRDLSFFIITAFFGFANSDISSTDLISPLIANAYDRQQEAAADEYSLVLMKEFYGSTKGAEEFFVEILKDKSQLIPAILSTHPHPQERLERIQMDASKN